MGRKDAVSFNKFLFTKRMETDEVVDEENQTLRDESNFILNVSQFFNQEALSDVKLKVADQTFPAHKFVLAKSSDVFRTMLYDNRWSQENQEEVELNESAECQQVFDKFLRFLYTAQISVSVDTAVGILCLADKYNVGSLKALCTNYMVENSKSPKVRNALCWYAWAKALGLDDLITQCTKTISWNTDALLKLPEWKTMEYDFVDDLLNQSDLVVAKEYALYKATIEWLLDENHVENLKDHAAKLLPLIRYPQMLVTELYEIENSDIMDREECKSILHELVGKAHRYRSLCPSQAHLNLSFSESFYLPRNYLDLAVDTVRMQNTLRFGIQVDVRTYAGPVPDINKDGEWKITYRKNGDNWTLQIFCHESATVNGEARIQASIIIYNEDEKVIQVEQVPTYVCSRGNHLAMNINVDNPDDSKVMAILLKPIPL